MATTTVRFDRQLRHLNPQDAEAWRSWLTMHRLAYLLIACPSVLVYNETSKRKLARLTVELLIKDNAGAFRSKKTITFSDSLLPFPSGYKIKEKP